MSDLVRMQYIELGTPAALLILPEEQIRLYTASTGEKPRIYESGDIIENNVELPGLRIEVAKFIG